MPDQTRHSTAPERPADTGPADTGPADTGSADTGSAGAVAVEGGRPRRGALTTSGPEGSALAKRRRAARRRRVEKAEARNRRARYSAHYDVDGPKVRLGVLWFGLLLVVLVVPRHLFGGVGHLWGRAAIVVLYAVVAFLAGRQSADGWKEAGAAPNPALAGAGAAAVALAGGLGTGLVGVVGLVVIAAACVAAAVDTRDGGVPAHAAGTTVACALVPGIAAASVGAAYRVDIGAVVVLLLLICIYETGDFLVGSGSANLVEGPVAGIVGVLVVTFTLSVIQPPPFDANTIWPVGSLVAVLCPAGAIVASALLPERETPARALRRLDALIVAGPVFVAAAWSVGR